MLTQTSRELRTLQTVNLRAIILLIKTRELVPSHKVSDIKTKEKDLTSFPIRSYQSLEQKKYSESNKVSSKT